MPFFFNPNLDTIIECLPTCCNAEGPLFPPMRCEEILNGFYVKAGLLAPEDAKLRNVKK